MYLSKVLKLLFLVSFFLPSLALAAGLSLSPAKINLQVGDTAVVRVRVTPNAGQAINAVAGDLLFPPDLLQISQQSKSSAFNFWPIDPVFDNSSGKAEFEALILNNTITSQTEVIAYSIKAKKAGVASLRFNDVSVLLGDGTGANVLSAVAGAEVVVAVKPTTEKVSTPKSEFAPTSTLPAPPGLSVSDSQSLSQAYLYESGPLGLFSSTHPNPQVWYSEAVAEVGWNADIAYSRIRAGVGRDMEFIPSEELPRETLIYRTALTEGLSFVGVQVWDGARWLPPDYFPIRVDVRPPALDLRLVNTKEATPFILVQATVSDNLSEVLEPVFLVSGLDMGNWDKISDTPLVYQSPRLAPGEYEVVATFVDEAGNAVTKVLNANIEAVRAPELFIYESKVKQKEPIVIQVKTEPSARVTLFSRLNNRTVTNIYGIADRSGVIDFSVLPDGFGKYTFWATVELFNGAQSDQSSLVEVKVSRLWNKENIITLGRNVIIIIVLVSISFTMGVLVGWSSRRTHKVVKFLRCKVGRQKHNPVCQPEKSNQDF